MTRTSAPPFDSIRVFGARTHNLREIDVDIPRDRLVVLTGVSGSGKSSLAFDTLFAEGQRRYLETLSTSARRFVDQLPRPDVDEIEGLPPTLSIEQRAGALQPRSTLGTTTGISDYLRLMYARLGTLHCHRCGAAVSAQSVQAIVDAVLSLEAGRKAMILAPVVRSRKGKHRELFEKIVRGGFVRARVDGEVIDAAAPPDLNKNRPHDIDVVIDRIVIKEGLRARLQESVELALKQGEGSCLVSHQEGDAWSDRLYSSRFACASCQLSFPEVEPRTFSDASPHGACPACRGLGVLSDPSSPGSSSREGSGIAGSGGATVQLSQQVCPECGGARLGPVGRAVRVAGMTLPELSAQNVTQVANLLQGWPALFSDPSRRLVATRLAEEIGKRLSCLERLGVGYLTLNRSAGSLSGGEYQRARLAGCLGSGLRGVCYLLDEPTLGLHARDAQRLFEVLCELRDQGNSVLVVEHDLDLVRQADFVIDIGPGAGGEGGRIVAQGTPSQIASQADSQTGRYLLRGGLLPPPISQESQDAPASSDSQSGEADGARNSEQCGFLPQAREWLTVSGACAHNLQNVTARIPLAALTCITGVSGSGKSSLIMETLVPLARKSLEARARPTDRANSSEVSNFNSQISNLKSEISDFKSQNSDRTPSTGAPASLPVPAGSNAHASAPQLTGIEQVARLVEIDQSPLGRSPRSNPATVSGLWDEVRRLLARTRDARIRGFRSGRFSFNAAGGGRCEACRGLGTRRIGMRFLPDLEIPCPVCRGARFNRQTLEVRYRNKSAADILAMRIDDARDYFANCAPVRRILETFVEVGLGYLTLGQSSATLSGGEAQRIRLATELSRVESTRTLYVLDEPTSGLHLADIERLLQLLRRLVRQGHTVVVIEHQLDVIRQADHVIDLGPEGGSGGGQIIAAGTPAEVAAAPQSHTGAALLPLRSAGDFSRCSL
ncbi:MAG: excinuclease ABC subunit UvrA [Planctomycetales bacterium]